MAADARRILITVIGILLQISDKSALGQIVAGSCTAVGGGVLGATLSIYVSAMGNKDALAEMRTIISNSMSARLLSPDAELDAVRGTTSVGSLSIDIVDSMNGRDERFRVEAAVRGTMLFVTDTWLDA